MIVEYVRYRVVGADRVARSSKPTTRWAARVPPPLPGVRGLRAEPQCGRPRVLRPADRVDLRRWPLGLPDQRCVPAFFAAIHRLRRETSRRCGTTRQTSVRGLGSSVPSLYEWAGVSRGVRPVDRRVLRQGVLRSRGRPGLRRHGPGSSRPRRTSGWARSSVDPISTRASAADMRTCWPSTAIGQHHRAPASSLGGAPARRRGRRRPSFGPGVPWQHLSATSSGAPGWRWRTPDPAHTRSSGRRCHAGAGVSLRRTTVEVHQDRAHSSRRGECGGGETHP